MNNSLPEWAILAGADPEIGWEPCPSPDWITVSLKGGGSVDVCINGEVEIDLNPANDECFTRKAMVLAAEAFIRGLKVSP